MQALLVPVVKEFPASLAKLRAIAFMSKSLTVDFIFLLVFYFILFFSFFFYFLFLEQLGLGLIGHAVTSVTT